MIPVIQYIAKQLSQFSAVESVILFGSRARGTHDERSDIDLAVVCPEATSSEWFQMTHIIDEAPTLLKIDLVRYSKLQQSFKKEILLEGIVVYERQRKNQKIHA